MGEYQNKINAESKKNAQSNDDDSDDDDQDDDMQQSQAQVPLNEIDPRKIKIVEQVFDFCHQTGDFKHAIGIAIECRRIDQVKQAIELSDNKSEMLLHCFNLCETVINSRTFRDEILALIVSLFDDDKSDANVDYNII